MFGLGKWHFCQFQNSSRRTVALHFLSKETVSCVQPPSHREPEISQAALFLVVLWWWKKQVSDFLQYLLSPDIYTNSKQWNFFWVLCCVNHARIPINPGVWRHFCTVGVRTILLCWVGNGWWGITIKISSCFQNALFALRVSVFL